jgi:hypothetical protein
MKSLKDFEGETILLFSPLLGDTPNDLHRVKLHLVEDAGIWIESQKMIESLLRMANRPSAPKTLVYFLPWHGVTAILSSIDEVSLSEKAFGIRGLYCVEAQAFWVGT